MKEKSVCQLYFMLIALTAMQGCIAGDGSTSTYGPDEPLMLVGDWVPHDTHRIDFSELPTFENSEHVVVHDVRQFGGNRINQHNYLIYHNEQYWVMWSDGPGVPGVEADKHHNVAPGHDQAGQKVSYATSKDGLNWSEARDITDTPQDEFGWIARGFWLREGKLLALASKYIAPSYSGEGLALHAFEGNEGSGEWTHLGLVYDNALNNFPPQQLSTGEWMMSRRDSLRNVHLLFGGTMGFDQWESIPMMTYQRTDFKAEEPSWWILPDHRLLALFRDNNKSGYLYRAFSDDNGRTWSEPKKTNFPDAASKFSSLRLKDGRYLLVSNPHPKKRDPLTLAVSDNGIAFNKLIYLVGERHIDYPHIIEQDGYLFIAFASAKQSVEIIRVKIAEIDGISMPPTVLEHQADQ